MSEADIADLIKLLSLEARGDVRGTAMEYVLGVTADKNAGPAFFHKKKELVHAVSEVTKDKRYLPVAREAWLALVNISAMGDEHLEQLTNEGCLERGLEIVLDTESTFPDEVSMLLGNLTRREESAKRLLAIKGENGKSIIFKLCDIFCKGPAYNKKGTFHHLANVLLNVTQLIEGRQEIMLRAGTGCVLQKLLPFTLNQDSIIRRGGVISTIRNCCFSSGDHEWLLSDEVDILPHILLPLIGPEELDEDDMDGMPDELQYQPEDKEREADADLRKLLIECLFQLCSTKEARKIMRDKKVYPVLRELHKWEPEEDVQNRCEEVVQLLITPEEEDKRPDDFRKLEIPENFDDPESQKESATVQIGAPQGYYLANQHNT
eukprot:m.97062 g.97062  ORF g.97062 m.97062 type:complete len:377 (-) comp13575_c0_seq5:40-1170(-)